MPLSILTFLINNWKFAVAAAIFVIWSLVMRNDGKRVVQDRWDASIVEIKEATQKEADRLQDLANQKSMEFETELAAQKLAQQKLNVRLRNEIRKNTNYSSCIVSPAIVQLFNDSTEGNAPSELNR